MRTVPWFLAAGLAAACALPEATEVGAGGAGVGAAGGQGGQGGQGGHAGGASCLGGASGDVVDVVQLGGQIVHALAVRQPYLYFGTDTAVMRVATDGCSAPETVHTKAGRARHIAVDDLALYYTVGGLDFYAGASWVVVVPFGGSAVELSAGSAPVVQIAVDDTHVYASRLGPVGTGGVLRAPKDASGPLALFVAAATDTGGRGLAIDGANVYFQDHDRIMWSPKSAANPVLLETTASGIYHLAADGTRVFWTDEVAGQVYAYALPSGPLDPLGGPAGRSIAVHGEWVYWSADNPTTGVIRRVRKDGSLTEVIADNQPCTAGTEPFGCSVAVDDGGVYWTVPALGSVRTRLP